MYTELKNLQRQNDERWIQISEVNMSASTVVGKGRLGEVMQIQLDMHDPLVAVPQVGEVWSVQRKRQMWYLDKRQEKGDEQTNVATLNPGDRRVESSDTLHLNGETILLNGEHPITAENSEELLSSFVMITDPRLSDTRTPILHGATHSPSGTDPIPNQHIRISRSTPQSVPTATETVITFDTDEFDTDTMFDVVNNPTRITFNTSGIYQAGSFALITAVGSSTYTYMRVNGTSNIAGNSFSNTVSGTTATVMSFFGVGDYIELIVRHNASGNQNVSAILWALRVA